jgi:iron only hydrogenase large subunit-like protein
LFADILTLKEALEFDEAIQDEQDYILTSCCCPMWIQMIRKTHPELLSHVPKSVSPMVATGRVIKKLVPDAFTVFVGPCLAKKAEAKEEDIKDAIDVVLTFRETKDLFDAARIDPDELKTDVREHSSTAGRIYAVASGVSLAVELTLRRLRPFKPIQVKSVFASGVPECKELIRNLEAKTLHANFIEGMGCVGGCVGGPRALIDKDTAKHKVREYAKKSLYPTPIDNPYVIEMLHRLGITTVEQLLEDQEIFTRHF